MVARNGSIGTNDFLGGAIWLWQSGCDGDMLADGETKNGVWRREGESVARRG
jgi:hypothetical protein